MRFQLKHLILWPRFAEEPPRVVSFRPGVVNVITGHSKTGKSAIIPIVDYCLGSDRCAIPVNRIRRSCSWFGIVVETDGGEMLLARREPEHQKSTGDMHVAQGPSLEIPVSAPVKNMNVDEVKGLLDRLAGLTQLDFDPDGARAGGFKTRPSFRDMTAFVFQPQNIVANPNVLFFKADLAEHREKLKAIFPFVLGAVTPAVLLLQHELQRVKSELRRKERELESVRTLSEQWVGEVRGRVRTAVELGLLAEMPPADTNVSRLLDLLRGAVTHADRIPMLTARALEASTSRLAALDTEERELSAELAHLRRRNADMTRYQAAAQRYADAVAIRRDRLGVSEWVGSLYSTDHECPLCGHADAPARAQVDALRIALRRVEDLASKTALPTSAVDRDLVRVRRAIELVTDQLNGIRREREQLSRESEGARSRQFHQAEAARFAGMVTEALSRYEAVSTDSALAREVVRLREDVKHLEAEIRERNVNAGIARAGSHVSNLIANVLPTFEAERPNDPVQLALDDLTIKVGGVERDDYLWEIGSGANWLSYHVATTLALHQHFLSQKASPVPSFIVYDQPSQVYFPKQAASAGEEEDLMATPIPDEDIAAVRRVFQAIAEVVVSAKGELQALVLDHAATDVWGGIEGVELVEEWREGTKLVPEHWPVESA